MTTRAEKNRLGLALRAALRKRRDELGLTQAQVASLLRCHPSLVAHFESGDRLPSLVNLCKLADALATTTDRLLQRDDA